MSDPVLAKRVTVWDEDANDYVVYEAGVTPPVWAQHLITEPTNWVGDVAPFPPPDPEEGTGNWGDITGEIDDQADLQSALDAKEDVANKSDDPTFATDSATKYVTEHAVKSALASALGSGDLLAFKGLIDASTNPNYPAANAGDVYRISVAGKIGGGSGVNVEPNDTLYCFVDASASGTQASVGANWGIVQANIDGAVVGPTVAVGDDIATYNGTSGKIIKDAGKKVSDLVDLTSAQNVTGIKTLNAPVIADFSSAEHDHHNAAGGGNLPETALALTDVTTNDVSTAAHGFMPKLPNDSTKFYRGDGVYATPSSGISSADNPGIYGDGSDGPVVIASGTTTLTRDMFYTTLEVQSGGILKTAGFRIFALTSITIDSGGTISNDGGAGGAPGGGSATPSQTTGASDGGGAGTSGVGTAGQTTFTTNSYGGSGGNGGTGNGGGNAGGAGTPVAVPAANVGTPRFLPGAAMGFMAKLNSNFTLFPGGGGGGGGGDGTNLGGGGGAGGGLVILNTPQLINNGTVSAKGGAGAAATVGNTGGGGGGGGGVIITNTAVVNSGSGTFVVTGGAAGALHGTGGAAVAGSVGTVFQFVWAGTSVIPSVRVPYAEGVRTAGGNITASSSTVTDIDASTLIASIPAVAGDVVEVDFHCQTSPANTSDIGIDVLITSGSSGRFIGSRTTGFASSWYCPNPGGAGIISTFRIAGTYKYTVQASDLTNGVLSLKAQYEGGGSGTAVFVNTANHPIVLGVSNLGH